MSGYVLLDLAEKHRRLLALREARDAGGDVAPRHELRALATHSPGALRELDRLPMPLLRERARRVEAALRGAPTEPWMDAACAWHALFGEALSIAAMADACLKAEERAAGVRARTGVAVDADWVRAVARPPGGRRAPVVEAAVARHLGVSVEAVRGWLAPWKAAPAAPG